MGGGEKWALMEMKIRLLHSAAVNGENLFGANCNYTKYYLHTFSAKAAISATERVLLLKRERAIGGLCENKLTV